MTLNRFAIPAVVAALALSGSVALAADPPHWTYEGEEGPAHWGALDPAYALCADGSAQTPIDVTSAVVKDLPDPEFAYASGPTRIVNNGHTIQAVPAEGDTVTVAGDTSSLLQMHFHSPGEHTIAGVAAAAEMHFVHKDASEVLTVVGVMIVPGAEDNAAWAPFIDALGTPVGTDGEIVLDWAALLPDHHASFRYEGSLTTPPCSEGVHWMLLQEPVALSPAQIDALKAAYDGNARPVQPVDGREVDLDWTSD